MRKLFLSFALLACIYAHAQKYWQQEVHYNIHVSLNDTGHSLKGFETIEYINYSPDTLRFLWFHLWPNAYKNQSTALYKQMKATGEVRNLENFNNQYYIDSLQFTVNDKLTVIEKDTGNIDIIKLILPSPLLPGKKITISTSFFVKMPPYFSRLGYQDQTYMITQWYPKPAVYDHKGWHPMPYLNQGEFYSEFGSYDVFITVPSNYVVGATGLLKTVAEAEQYKDIGRKRHAGDTTAKFQPHNNDNLKTLEYHAENVHDFAWFADKNFIIDYDTLKLPSGKIIDVFSYHQPASSWPWHKSIEFIKDAVLYYSNWIGEYGYPVVSAVEGPDNSSAAGMEYPTITLISLPRLSGSDSSGEEELDGVIVHEVGHNWFYGMLGNNERQHPWMDEGINSFYEFRYQAEKYRTNYFLRGRYREGFRKLSLEDFLPQIYKFFNERSASEAIEYSNPAEMPEAEYAEVEYIKAAAWLYLMEKSVGKNNFDKGMRAYFKDWKFKHPYPKDMQISLEHAIQKSLKNIFSLLYHQGRFN